MPTTGMKKSSHSPILLSSRARSPTSNAPLPRLLGHTTQVRWLGLTRCCCAVKENLTQRGRATADFGQRGRTRRGSCAEAGGRVRGGTG
jgi:hypothetical protein